jgi:hypothetical protein
MKQIFITFLFFCVLLSAAYANTTPHAPSNKIAGQNLFSFTAGYRVPVTSGKIINSGHGLYFEGGLNTSKLFADKLSLGIYGGWAWRDILWSTSFNNSFLGDYKNAVNISDRSFSSLDSAVITSSSNLFETRSGHSVNMPGCATRSFHNYSLYFGIILKLPSRWLPVIKLYTGSSRTHYMGTDIITPGDNNILQLRRRMYGAELEVLRGCGQKNVLKHLSLSLYGELYNFTNSSLYFSNGHTSATVELNKFTNPGFLRKYNNEVSAGFKLAFSII